MMVADPSYQNDDLCRNRKSLFRASCRIVSLSIGAFSEFAFTLFLWACRQQAGKKVWFAISSQNCPHSNLGVKIPSAIAGGSSDMFRTLFMVMLTRIAPWCVPNINDASSAKSYPIESVRILRYSILLSFWLSELVISCNYETLGSLLDFLLDRRRYHCRTLRRGWQANTDRTRSPATALSSLNPMRMGKSWSRFPGCPDLLPRKNEMRKLRDSLVLSRWSSRYLWWNYLLS